MVDFYFNETEEELQELADIPYMENPRIKEQYEAISKIKKELMSTTSEALEILDQVNILAESIEKESEMNIIDDMLTQHEKLKNASSRIMNTDIMWAVYGLSEYKRMIKIFCTYAIMEQKRKEFLHHELLKARGYALQLDGQIEKQMGK